MRNNVAIVTGASRGIGRAIALELGRQGAIVIGTATTESGSQAIDRHDGIGPLAKPGRIFFIDQLRAQ